MSPGTFLHVTLQDRPRLHVLQTELTEEELGQLRVFLENGICYNIQILAGVVTT